jgi:hypothetical protein
MNNSFATESPIDFSSSFSKICNALIAFDACCQLFVVLPYIVQMSAVVLAQSAIDFRLCLASLMLSTLASFASFLAIYLMSLERLVNVIWPLRLK